MPDAYKAAILELLRISERQLNRNLPEATSYDTLKTTVINQELQDEIEALRLMLEGDDFDNQFKARCQERAEQNADSCLSFSALPDGVCNTLYWKIAETLYQPRNMGEMLTILSPQVTQFISAEFYAANPLRVLNEYNLKARFKNQAIRSLTGPATEDMFKHLVISGNTLLDARDIAGFEFATHLPYFTALSQTYPEIAASLYQHNSALVTLHDLLLSVRTRKPYDVISEFIKVLQAGGTGATGQHFATTAAAKAVTDFFAYIESLPAEKKETLLQLGGTGLSSTLTDVIASLRRGNCVEMAADNLSEIIRVNKDRPILNEYPAISHDTLIGFKKAYGRSKHLSTTGCASTTTLPSSRLQSAMSRMVIRTKGAWINILRELPENLYAPFIQHATFENSVIPSYLLLMVQNFNIKKEAVSAAIQSAPQKLGAYLICKLCFDSYFPDERAENFQAIIRLIESIQPDQRFPFITKPIDTNELPFLHWIKATHGIEGVEAILALLPEPARKNAMRIKNAEGFTVHQAPQRQPRNRGPAEETNLSFACELLKAFATGLIGGLVITASIFLYLGVFALAAAGIALLINPAAVGIALSVGMFVGSGVLMACSVAACCGFFSHRTPAPTAPRTTHLDQGARMMDLGEQGAIGLIA